MKVLLIGYGSIGRKHYKVLDSLKKQIESIDIVTKQSLTGDFITYKMLEDVPNLNIYDYFIIASETVKHYVQLKFLCARVKNKKILVEKPLFEKIHSKLNLNQNQVFVAYNLRFHPIIQKIKKLMLREKCLSVHIYCGQYLPTWRQGVDYRQSYSASKEQGGGVLRDLSHELDYMSWLFGDLDEYFFINEKISGLEITSDDTYHCIGKTKAGVIVDLSIDYISKKPIRTIMIHFEDLSLYSDLIASTLECVDKDGISTMHSFEKSPMIPYQKMHHDILSDQEYMCTYKEGLKTLEVFPLDHQ